MMQTFLFQRLNWSQLITGPLSFQLMVDGTLISTVLEGLTPLTEYVVTVYSVLGGISSEPLKGTETTCECFLFTSSPLYPPLPPSPRRSSVQS